MASFVHSLTSIKAVIKSAAPALSKSVWNLTRMMDSCFHQSQGYMCLLNWSNRVLAWWQVQPTISPTTVRNQFLYIHISHFEKIHCQIKIVSNLLATQKSFDVMWQLCMKKDWILSHYSLIMFSSSELLMHRYLYVDPSFSFDWFTCQHVRHLGTVNISDAAEDFGRYIMSDSLCNAPYETSS